MQNRSLKTIAQEIKADWRNIDVAAKEYLKAMLTLEKISDIYVHEDGRSVVLYFLANAQTWRGAKAREIKLELNKML